MQARQPLFFTNWDQQRKILVASIEPAIVFGVALLVIMAVRHFVIRVLKHRLKPDGYSLVVLSAIRVPSILWALAAALAFSVRFARLSSSQIHYASVSIVAFLIISFSLVTAAMFTRMLSVYGERRRLPFAVAGLSHTLTYIFVLSIGGMMLLHYMGLEITPLLTALGVGGLAVALALQDTLANFFAGIHILVENPISPGQFIKLSSGEEGTVTDIGWRTTRVQTGNYAIVVIPNTKITSGILTNFSLPAPRTAADISILVAHEADPEQVKRIALEEAAKVHGVLDDPAPMFLCDPGVTPTYTQYKVIIHVASRPAQGLAQSELRMRIGARFRDESVPLPKIPGVAV